MRMRARTQVLIDFVNETERYADAARAAARLGYEMHLEQDPPGALGTDVRGVPVMLRRSDGDWFFGDAEIDALVMVRALADDIPPERVLELCRQKLERHGWLGVSPRVSLAKDEPAADEKH